jgi:hypothetical protein
MEALVAHTLKSFQPITTRRYPRKSSLRLCQKGNKLMKAFVIIEHFPADGGHKITIVRANDNEDALKLYKEHSHRDCLPSWVKAEEISEQVTEVFRYDNPNYEG